jgi:transposase, IS30 family
MSIYRYVAHDRAAGGQLFKKLCCQRLKRRRYAKGYGGQGKIVNRLDISQRPAHIAPRRTVGHWEVDTVVGSTGRGKAVLVSIVERKSGLTRLALSADRTALKVSQALIGALIALRARVLTLTNDNEHEFALHSRIDAALGCQSYFAKPYANSQRGTAKTLNVCRSGNSA